MTMEEALYAYLSTYAGLTALIGTRVYPFVLPQNAAKPAVTFQRVDTPREYTHDGYAGLAHPRFQFACFALSQPASAAVAEQIRLALQGYTGTMGGVGGVVVQFAVVVDQRDGYENDTKLFSTALDVIIWHEEATA